MLSLRKLLCILLFVSAFAEAGEYKIGTAGAHAFVQFRVKHLGYSWLYGRFNRFEGEFTYDKDHPKRNKIRVDIDMASLDSNHAERDKHLRGKKFLNVKKFPKSTFISREYSVAEDGSAQLTGDLTFYGVTRPVTIEVEYIGGGPDPWGGYRHGFEGRAVIKPADFGLDLTKRLGPSSAEVELFLTVEGIRQRSHLKK